MALFDNSFIPVPLHPRSLGFWNSGFQVLDSGFQVLDSGFFASGTWIPDSLICFPYFFLFVFLAVFLIAKPRISNSTSKSFQNDDNFLIHL